MPGGRASTRRIHRRTHCIFGRAFTSNGRANSSTIVELRTLKALGTVATGANPDSIRYLQDRKEVWTFNHTGGSITAFDPLSGKVIATIDVGGELEEAVEDASAGRVYVNVEDKGAIASVDTVKHAVVARWPLAGCEGPTGLAFDPGNHLLLSAYDGKMAVTDSRSGVRLERHWSADHRPRRRAERVHRRPDGEDAAVGTDDVARSGVP
jgi:DNA-binding beta-propeller fold protein YncE